MKVLILICTLCILITSASAFTYTKLPVGHVFTPELIEQEKVSGWAKAEVALAENAGLVTEHTRDYMTREITRFQFAELIVNLVEKSTGTRIQAAPDTTFTDCKESVVLKAKAAGIVNGKTKTTFEPDAKLTREELATMLLRAIEYINHRTNNPLPNDNTPLVGYTDVKEISDFAQESMTVLVNAAMIKGTDATTLSPKETCTVEQSVVLIYRAYR
ncbi:MAG: S-layer homology domain-containing protein [Evtepia sp.]